MRLSLLFLFIFSVLPIYGAESSLLDSLDILVINHQKFEIPRREAATRARLEYDTASTDASRYNALRGLYEAYRSFRIDSAIIVADLRLRTARKLNNPSKIASATLNLAEAYLKSGAPERAIAILDTLPSSAFEDYHFKYRNSIYRNSYLLKSSTALLPSDRMEAIEKIRALRDSALAQSDPDSRAFAILEAERLRDAGLYGEAVSKMEEADIRFDFSGDAAIQYTLGETYLAAGDRSKAIDALAKSSILDLKEGTKEYKSLILLASLLFEEGQTERAFNYINRAFEDADFSRANLRQAEIMKSMPVIDRAYHDAQQTAAARNRSALILAGIILLMLLIILGFAIFAFRTKRKMLSTIREINAALEKKNASLMEADALKLSHINGLMLANATFISRIREFRKTVYRLLVTGQYDKALDAVKSDKVEAKDLDAFYEMFDKAFLSIFPDFVDNVNRFMRIPIEQKQASRLTPELRVIALMKLGTTSTADISRMLHYSSQTVYNLRSSIKTMLNVDLETFETYLTTN